VESPTVQSPTATAADALYQPLYGATFVQAVSRFFRKYATFSGRASRSEFWWAYLVYAAVYLAIYIPAAGAAESSVTVTADGQIAYGAGYWTMWGIGAVAWLATIVPFLALVWRRLHDTNRPGWYYLIGIVPFGVIFVIVFLALRTNPDGERFDR
ncbi:MAG TPA: DUF805 domain-containing protein, partial [Agromyces mariniharenae]|nr:DUF805 domain-containing protein [Agromyces mariniharenae]